MKQTNPTNTQNNNNKQHRYVGQQRRILIGLLFYGHQSRRLFSTCIQSVVNHWKQGVVFGINTKIKPCCVSHNSSSTKMTLLYATITVPHTLKQHLFMRPSIDLATCKQFYQWQQAAIKQSCCEKCRNMCIAVQCRITCLDVSGIWHLKQFCNILHHLQNVLKQQWR